MNLKKKTKQTQTTTGTEIEITWRLISGEGEEGERGKELQGIRSITGRHKMDRGRLRIA